MSNCSGCTCDPAICKGGGGPPETFEQAFDTIVAQLRSLMIFKQEDYGNENIDDGGEIGLAVRASDKTARLRNLYGIKDGTPKVPKNETVEDTWVDVVNYGIIALMVHRGWWGLPLQGHTVGATLTRFYENR